MTPSEATPGAILTGPLFPEPVQVITVRRFLVEDGAGRDAAF